jgi:hypothetical protein
MAKAKSTAKAGKYSKVYREFTRIKFNKYKQQYPKIRESELIAKILREWEAMDDDAKSEMAKNFQEKSGKDFLQQISSSDSKNKDSKEKKQGG